MSTRCFSRRRTRTFCSGEKEEAFFFVLPGFSLGLLLLLSAFLVLLLPRCFFCCCCLFPYLFKNKICERNEKTCPGRVDPKERAGKCGEAAEERRGEQEGRGRAKRKESTSHLLRLASSLGDREGKGTALFLSFFSFLLHGRPRRHRAPTAPSGRSSGARLVLDGSLFFLLRSPIIVVAASLALGEKPGEELRAGLCAHCPRRRLGRRAQG